MSKVDLDKLDALRQQAGLPWHFDCVYGHKTITRWMELGPALFPLTGRFRPGTADDEVGPAVRFAKALIEMAPDLIAELREHRRAAVERVLAEEQEL